MTRKDEPKSVGETSTSLVNTIRSDSLGEVLSTVADTGLDALVTSGALDGVPVFGILSGVLRAQHEIRGALYLQPGEDIANALFSIGVLSELGIDGGTLEDPNSGGTLFAINRYGELLVKFGLEAAK